MERGLLENYFKGIYCVYKFLCKSTQLLNKIADCRERLHCTCVHLLSVNDNDAGFYEVIFLFYRFVNIGKSWLLYF